MPSKPDILDPSKLGEVRNLLASSGVVVFFFKEGCPYCISTDRPWNQTKHHKFPYTFVKVESAAVPPELDGTISGFPHFEVVHPDGTRESVSGSKDSSKDLEDALHLQKKGGLRRFHMKRSRRRNSRRLSRRTRKRL